jgi:hypothetical protein
VSLSKRARRYAHVVPAVVLASTGAVTLIGAGTAGAEPVSVEFEFTGASEDFVVPAGVCSLTVDAYGAQGGGGAGFEGEDDTGVGGEGGRATATIPVTPGETLIVTVGEEGHDGVDVASDALDASRVDAHVGDDQVTASGLPATGAGGFNGGGDGGGASIVDFIDGGGGGGGASDVRQGGAGLEHRVVVAGGGGGGGGDVGDDPEPGASNGGDGGGETGTDGNESSGDTPPGLGGTQTAGGAAPTGFDPTSVSGELGQGGGGGIGSDEEDAGGGGGGGYYGGGGGAGALFDEGGTNNGAGGGGGSGFGPTGTVFETGNQFGDGLVILTYDPAVQTCPIVVEPRFTG